MKLAFLLAFLVAALTIQPVEARSRYTPTSLSLVQAAPIYHGGTVTFTFAVGDVRPRYKDAHCTEFGDCPSVQVLCTQNGDFTQPIYADIQIAWSAVFLLDSGTYQDGTPFWNPTLTAQCRAILFDYRNDYAQWATVYFEALP